jgi:hypothetical protein
MPKDIEEIIAEFESFCIHNEMAEEEIQLYKMFFIAEIKSYGEQKEKEGYDNGKGEIIMNSAGFIETGIMSKTAFDLARQQGREEGMKEGAENFRERAIKSVKEIWSAPSPERYDFLKLLCSIPIKNNKN